MGSSSLVHLLFTIVTMVLVQLRLLFLAYLHLAMGQQDCPNGWSEFESNCYKMSKGRVSKQDQAQKNCQKEGGHLASIHSEAENNFVANLTNGVSIWVGGTYDPTNQTWMWVDGSPLTFTGWPDDEPSGDGNCMLTNWGGDGEWNDRPCNQRGFSAKFLCKRSNARKRNAGICIKDSSNRVYSTYMF